MMRAEARPPRPKWPWVVVAGIAAAVVIFLVVVNSQASPTPTPTPTPTAAPTSSPGGPDASPSGCLGGPGLDAEMVLATQAAAPHSSNGAVEVAAAMLRWLKQGPLPSGDEADEVAANAIASTAPDGFKDLRGTVEAGVAPPTGVENGQSYSVSMLDGMWHLEEASADRAVVTLGAKLVVDGALSANHYVTATWTMVWEDGAWKLAGGKIDRTWDELYPIGRTFTGDC